MPGEFLYLGLDRELMAVDVSLGPPLEFGTPQKLFVAPVQQDWLVRNRYVVTPDGEWFLLLALLDREHVPPMTVVLDWAGELGERYPVTACSCRLRK